VFERDTEQQKKVEFIKDSDPKTDKRVLKVNDVLDKLTPFQMKLLSELQIKNAEKLSDHEKVLNIANSRFLSSLAPDLLYELKQRNEAIFEEISSQAYKHTELDD
jgi:hypothetical protein